jgi:hypothetical protein
MGHKAMLRLSKKEPMNGFKLIGEAMKKTKMKMNEKKNY